MPATLQIRPSLSPAYELLIGNTATIGRTEDNTVCFRGSPLVSRQHALIRCHDGYRYQLVDLGSRNGTFMNGERVVVPVNLEDGASISVANNVLIFVRTEAAVDDAFAQVTLEGSKAGHATTNRAAALLVCDIRGFSSMSERLAGAELARFLGSWFRVAGKQIQDSGGSIDKFIGDAVLAYWSAAAMDIVDCDVALRTAHHLLGLAAKRSWPDGRSLEIGVALHCGVVSCGNVGVDAERDATIIGDAVNTVFRLESVMKELKQRILASGDFYERVRVPLHFEQLGERQLKGKRQHVVVYGIL